MRSMRVPVALLLTLTIPNLAFAQVGVGSRVATFAQAPAPASEDLTDEQKKERAKTIYIEAERLAAEGKWKAAVKLYEEAYYLVPGKHGFAHKVGVAAWEGGDCNKANNYLRHFLKYGDDAKHGDKIDEAKQILGEISVSGCATEEPATTTTTTTTTATIDPSEAENPLGKSTTEVRQNEARDAREAKKESKRGLLMGGSVLAGVGVLGVATGIAGLVVASSSADSLQSLSSNATTSGFPVGDYACRDGNAECPFDLERRMKTGNILGWVGLSVGGAALIGGAAMLAIYMVARKKNGGALETAPTEATAAVELTGLGPLMLPGGGGGAMAEIRF